MTTPPKPWERGAVLQGSGVTPTSAMQNSIYPGTSRQGLVMNAMEPQFNSAIGSGTAIPRPPPRPNNSSGLTSGYRPGISSFGTTAGYSPFGMNRYSSYGNYGSYGSPYSTSYSPYGGYGGYGMSGYGNYGQMPYGQTPFNQYALENRFIQAAEESSRPAFQSLESLVHAFGSVSMMLESTFFAIHSSFRAVLGVAENFGRMRGLLSQVFSALTIFKAVNYAYIKLLQLLGLRKPGEADQLWAEAAITENGVAGLAGSEQSRSSAWPIVMFMSLVMGGPYLIWKLVRSVQASLGDPSNMSLNGHKKSDEAWVNGESPCYMGKAEYGFQARQSDELSFAVGDIIVMAPSELQTLKSHGWMLASRLKDSAGNMIKQKQVGLVPLNHFKKIYNYNNKKKSTAGLSNPVVSTSVTNNTNINQPLLESFDEFHSAGGMILDNEPLTSSINNFEMKASLMTQKLQENLERLRRLRPPLSQAKSSTTQNIVSIAQPLVIPPTESVGNIQATEPVVQVPENNTQTPTTNPSENTAPMPAMPSQEPTAVITHVVTKPNAVNATSKSIKSN